MHRHAGFTLFELVIVIALMGLCLSLGFFYIGKNNDMLIRYELHRLSLAVHAAQYAAYLKHTVQEVAFDVPSSSYHTEGAVRHLAPDVIFGIPTSLDSAVPLGPPSHPTTSLKHPITAKNNRLYIYPDGTMSSGTIYITDRALSRLYALSVDIGHISHMRYYRFEQGKWIRIS